MWRGGCGAATAAAILVLPADGIGGGVSHRCRLLWRALQEDDEDKGK